jgi:hypothetical protein
MTPESLCEMVGEEAAFVLISRNPGQRVYVPSQMTASFIERFGGDEKAAASLIGVMARTFFEVPLAKAWRVLKMRERGARHEDIALALSMTYRGVKRICSDMDRLHKQAALPTVTDKANDKTRKL